LREAPEDADDQQEPPGKQRQSSAKTDGGSKKLNNVKSINEKKSGCFGVFMAVTWEICTSTKQTVGPEKGRPRS